MAKSSEYEEVIKKVPLAWQMLKKHPHQRTAGIDHESISTYRKNESANIAKLQKELKKRAFAFSEMRPHSIASRGKKRTILISTVDDRIVCKAILMVIESKFEKYNSNCDFSREVAFSGITKPSFRGVPLAAYCVLECIAEGYTWILEADIKKFFDNVPKAEILKTISDEVNDVELFKLIQQVVEFKVDKESQNEEDFSPYKGIAQGSSISPLLASVYLFQFDEFIKASKKDVRLVRYVDDFIVLCKTEEVATKMYEIVQAKLKEMGLEIHGLDRPDEKGKVKTRIVNVFKGPFEFLGLQFNGKDIDIAPRKKDDLMHDVGAIRHAVKGKIYTKTARIERKLRSFIRQYIHPHYLRTKGSLKSMTNRIHADIEQDFVDGLKDVFGKDYFTKLPADKKKKLLDVLGIQINKLIS